MVRVKESFKRLFTLQGLMLILVSAVLLEATSLIQYYFAKQALEEEATHRAGAELENTSLKITNVMDTTITIDMKCGTYKSVCSSFL